MKQRECGTCQLCCELIEVDALNKPALKRCPHQCDIGCGVHTARPNACRAFTCAWREGLLPKSAIPKRTRMVIYNTVIYGDTMNLPCLQAVIEPNAKPHRPTWKWLLEKSELLPVVVIQGDRYTLYREQRRVLKWQKGQAVRYSINFQGKLSARLAEGEAALSPQLKERMKQTAIPETNPEYAANVAKHSD